MHIVRVEAVEETKEVRVEAAELNEIWSFVGKKTNPGVYGIQLTEILDLRLRTRIKRLTRKTICFSKQELMHDLVIGLFINRYELEMPIEMLNNQSRTLPTIV